MTFLPQKRAFFTTSQGISHCGPLPLSLRPRSPLFTYKRLSLHPFLFLLQLLSVGVFCCPQQHRVSTARSLASHSSFSKSLPKEIPLLFHWFNYHIHDFHFKHLPYVFKCFLGIPLGFSNINSNSTYPGENLSILDQVPLNL